MICKHCGGPIIKDGWKNGVQRFKCVSACLKNGLRKPRYEEFVVEKQDLIGDVGLKSSDWRSILTDAADRCDTRIELTGYDRVGTFKFDDDHIDVLWSADWHLGGMYTDHRLIRKHMERLIEIENLYIGIVGDANDNFITSKLLGPMLQQVLSPTEQAVVLVSILKELVRAGRLLFFVLGNHELFSERTSGATIFQILEMASVPVASDRFEATIHVGNQTYIVDAMHKARGNSITNNQHGNMRNLIHNNPKADIVVSGHKHTPGYEFIQKYGEDKHLITVGSYKGDDDFSWSGWPNGQAPFFPITRLSGTEKKVRLIYSIDEL